MLLFHAEVSSKGSGLAALLHTHILLHISILKPLKGPFRDWPLAICDDSTVNPVDDIQPADQMYADCAVENYQVHYSDRQRW